MYELLKWAYGMNQECYRLLAFRYIVPVAFGCCLALNDKRIKTGVSVVVTLIGLSFIMGWRYFGYHPRILTYWTGTSWLACLYVLPIAWVLIRKVHWHNRILETIGKASFDVFLVQATFYGGFVKYVYQFIPYTIPCLVANVLVCCVIGIIFWELETGITEMVFKSIEPVCCRVESINLNILVSKYFFKSEK